MTPKEKAKELLDAMWVYSLPNANGSWNNAKQCALICVEEILKEQPDLVHGYTSEGQFMVVDNIRKQYWKLVKTEIEKL